MIGYYIHHHGHGHLARATAVAAALTSLSGEGVVALSSMPEPARHPFAGWVRLADDPHLDTPDDAEAGGALHWAPLNSTGYRERMHDLVQWAGTHRPRLVVVDVSVEVTAALRLIGVPVVVTAMPGERADDAHTLAYRLAAAVVAPWPREVLDAPSLEPFAGKTTWVGAFSRFDGRTADGPSVPGRVVVLFGSGGGGPSAQDLTGLARSSGRDCVGLGGAGLPWRDDVWTQLGSAEVVVTHGGLNALGEVAAARRAAVIIAQPRPFDEQRTTAYALADAGIAVVLDRWPDDAHWPDVLDRAAALGGAGWARWNDHDGAHRFAATLAAVGSP